MRQPQKIFTYPDSWKGGYVDTLMYFGAAGIDEANAVLRAIWSYSRLEGPYLHRDVEPDQQAPIPVPQMSDDCLEYLFGVYTLHDGSRSVFEHSTVFDEDGLWVYAGPTVGSLPRDWDIGAYPYPGGNLKKWLPPLYDDLRALVKHVSQSTPLKAATYGWTTVLDCELLLEAIEGRIPDAHLGPIDIWRDGHHSYFPATHFEAPVRPDPRFIK